MKDLTAIEALYLEIDRGFEVQREASVRSGDKASADRFEAKQTLNDQAYFILAWGQMETAIDETCRSAIRARWNSTNRRDRRGWEIYNPEDKRLSGLSFENRATLVLDRKRGADCSWIRAIRYYNMRNQIAHGKLSASRIDIVEVIQDFFLIQVDLEA